MERGGGLLSIHHFSSQAGYREARRVGGVAVRGDIHD